MKRSVCECFTTIVLILLGLAPAADAQLSEFYVAVDGRSEPFTAPAAHGGGAYPDNPNLGRLTFLYNHVDHFHGIGTYAYEGPAGTPALLDTNANNRIPEAFTGQLPLELLPGSGIYAGKNVTMHQVGVGYSNLELRNVHSLSGLDDVLYGSSNGRWTSAFEAADIHLRLLSVSSAQLHLGSPTDPHALPVGGDVHLGEGDEMFTFTPVLWLDSSAPAGHYWAELQLVDLSGTFGSSGRFYLDVRNVPEPAGLLLALSGVLLAVPARQRGGRVVRAT